VLVNECMTANSQARQTSASITWPWLTIEFVLWGLLLVLGLCLRLYRLDAAPLSAEESRAALAAWRFAQGQGPPLPGEYTPLLFAAQWFLFLVAGASEVTARLFPALAGSALVLAPALLRRPLGRVGALAAGGLLALSPIAVFMARNGSGHSTVAVAAVLLVGGAVRYFEQRPIVDWVPNGGSEPPSNQDGVDEFTLGRIRGHHVALLGLALMLVASPLAYSALLAMAGAAALQLLIDRVSRQQLQEAWANTRLASRLPMYPLGFLIASILLLSTGFGWHPSGLGAAADLLPQWLDGFVAWSNSLSVAHPVRILLVYEPLILFTGVVGGLLAFLRSTSSTTIFITLWSILATLLAVLRPERNPGDLLITLVPLACLGGLALDMLVSSLRRQGQWLNEGLYLAVSLPLWAYMLLNLATYTSRSGDYTDVDLLFIHAALPTYLTLAIATILLLMILAAGMGFVQGRQVAGRGVAASLSLALLVYTIAASWGVNQNRPADPSELLVTQATAPEVRLLKQTLARISTERTSDAHAIDVSIVGEDPVLAWELRDYPYARFVEADGGSIPSARPEGWLEDSAVIAPKELAMLPLGTNYRGQSFRLYSWWQDRDLPCGWYLPPTGFDQARQLDCDGLIQWLLYRRIPSDVSQEEVVLWIQQDGVGD
jgi:hypothetical protein